MKPTEQISDVQQREKIIASACVKLSEDLRKISPLTYAFFFNLGDMSSTFEKINHFVEQRFTGGKMSFSCTGECVLNWAQIPAVALDFEFVDSEVSAFFRLQFSESELSVSLHHISFCNGTGNPSENTRLLARQIMRSSQ